MEPETFDIWARAIGDLSNAEAAELAVIELYKSQAFRPTVADVVASYHAQLRRIPEPVAVLPPATRAGIPAVPDLAWSPEGARWAAGIRVGLREEDVVAFEQQAQAAYLGLGSTSTARKDAVLANLRSLVDRAEENIGKDSDRGRRCAKHNRWVANGQTKDPCYGHVFAEIVPESVDPDLFIPLPPCSRCGGKNVGECGHLADLWAEEVDARTKALLKKRAEARDARRGQLV